MKNRTRRVRSGAAPSAKVTRLADWKLIDLDVFGSGFDLGFRFVRNFGAGAIYAELGFRLDSGTNRARLLEHGVAREFLTRVGARARSLQLFSDEHFTVDGTLVEAWASLKSFKRKGQGPTEPPDDPCNVKRAVDPIAEVFLNTLLRELYAA